MSNKRILDVENIGLVELVKNRRAKRIIISIKASNGVRVSIPYLVSFKTAEKFLLSKKDWIRKSLSKIEFQRTIFTPNSDFKTYFRFLEMRPIDTDEILCEVTDQKIIITYPNILNEENEELQNFTVDQINKILRIEAKQYLPIRLNELANRHNFSYNRVFIKNTKSRWGSCSSKNNINLCLHLMRLPNNLIDYVILHELVHTIHKNHGSDFWQLLNEITGNAKELDKLLKNYSISIF